MDRKIMLMVIGVLATLLIIPIATAAPVIEECATPTVLVNDDQIMVIACLKNTGDDMTEDWLLEMDPRESSLLSWLPDPDQEPCDPDHPETVHICYRLDQYEQRTITLISSVEDGSYDIYLLTVESCFCDLCEHPPYGWGTFITTVIVSTGTGAVCGDGVCEGGETYQNCPEDCEAPDTCGNGVCDYGETYETCPSDCPMPEGQNVHQTWRQYTCVSGYCQEVEEDRIKTTCSAAGCSQGACIGDVDVPIVDVIITSVVIVAAILGTVGGIAYWRLR